MQLLSGHGYFRSYLLKMSKALSTDCLYCPDVENNAEHTFFNCEKWATRIASLVADIRRIAPGNRVGAMPRREDVWTHHIGHYVEGILRVKKKYLERV